MFEKLSGARPTSYAAPGWQLSADTLSVQQELGLEFCSDVRGFSPFLPVFNGVQYAPVQVPTTLPTMIFALEAFYIGLVCAPLGIGFTYLACFLINKGTVNVTNPVAFFNPDLGVALLLLATGLITAVLSAFFPSFKAAKKPPVTAIHSK